MSGIQSVKSPSTQTTPSTTAGSTNKAEIADNLASTAKAAGVTRKELMGAMKRSEEGGGTPPTYNTASPQATNLQGLNQIGENPA